MARIPVFYSFHFDNDVMRVQQVRNMGVIDGNEPASPNDWEQLRRKGDAAVQAWIDENLRYKRCLVVLVGTETASRRWVRYEIEEAWTDGKGILGVHIHNLACPRSGTCSKGPSPFDSFRLTDGRAMSSVVTCYDPSPLYAYSEIQRNLGDWISTAIAQRNRS